MTVLDPATMSSEVLDRLQAVEQMLAAVSGDSATVSGTVNAATAAATASDSATGSGTVNAATASGGATVSGTGANGCGTGTSGSSGIDHAAAAAPAGAGSCPGASNTSPCTDSANDQVEQERYNAEVERWLNHHSQHGVYLDSGACDACSWQSLV